jgi:hypothetical protein
VFAHKIADAMAVKQILDFRHSRSALDAILAEDDDALCQEMFSEWVYATTKTP